MNTPTGIMQLVYLNVQEIRPHQCQRGFSLNDDYINCNCAIVVYVVTDLNLIVENYDRVLERIAYLDFAPAAPVDAGRPCAPVPGGRRGPRTGQNMHTAVGGLGANSSSWPGIIISVLFVAVSGPGGVGSV